MSLLKAISGIVFLLCSVACGGVREFSVEVVAEYPHDRDSYTQGLFFRDGRLYESTGLNGKSTFREVDLKTGEAVRRLDFNDEYFVEGSVMMDDRLYILTWQNRQAFVYDADSLAYLETWQYPREGWGITTDGECLYASDGSSYIYVMDGNYGHIRRIPVRRDGRSVRWLNELEFIDGKIWANVYVSDTIVIIDPEDGKVTATVDCSGLLPDSLRTRDTDVLNGIAFDDRTGKIYLTGKNWPRIYEVRLVRKR